MYKQLKNYQKECVDSVVKTFKKNNKCQIHMACGTGKTFISLYVVERCISKNSKVCIVVPSLGLVSQFLKETLDHFGNIDYLLVCSDETTDISGEAEKVTNFFDLETQYYRVTTDSRAIRTVLKKKRTDPLFVFSTLHSLDRVIDAQRNTKHRFDITIFDEAHHLATNQDTMFATALNGGLKSNKHLFMTATPKLYVSRNGNEQTYSMDDKNTFGTVAFTYPFSQAIKDDNLSDYDIILSGQTKSKIDEDDKNQHDVNCAYTLLNAIASSEKSNKVFSNPLSRIVTFHNRVSNAKNFCNLLEKVNAKTKKIKRELVIEHINSTMPVKERNVILNRLAKVNRRKQCVIITNVNCISEGIDIPALDAITIVDNRKSKIGLIQVIGRVIRKAKNKSHAYVILPIIVPEHKNEINESELEYYSNTKGYTVVYDVLKAVKSHDDMFVEKTIDKLDEEEINDKVKLIYDLDKEQENNSNFSKWLSTSLIRCVIGSRYNWYENYKKLKEFISINKRYPSERENVLGIWINNQRCTYRGTAKSSTLLTKQQIKQLESLPGWEWNPYESLWNKRFKELQEFIKKNKRYPNLTKNVLGNWIGTQRSNYRGTRKDRPPLTKQQIKLLESLPGWEWNLNESLWNKRFKELQEFIKKNKRYPNLTKSVLGIWINSQRRTYRGTAKKNLPLTKQQIKQLESLPGWEWNPYESLWNKRFKELQEFIKKNKRYPTKDNNRFLTSWINTQRCTYRGTTKSSTLLTKQQIKQLESLPGWEWNPYESLWNKRFKELQEFIKKNKRYPNQHKEKILGNWIGTQRSNYRGTRKDRPPLTKQQIKLLESLPGWKWNPKGRGISK